MAATTTDRPFLVLLILSLFATHCLGTCPSGGSGNVCRYAEQHFKQNWAQRVEELKFPSNRNDSVFVYLPHEVMLVKQALSKNEQLRLFSQFRSAITADGRQTDQSLCAEDRCVLFTSTMSDRKDEYLQKLGTTFFSETAEQLAGIQQVNPGYIDENLKLNSVKKSSFSAVHGVWYNENGYLRRHLDRTWNRANKASPVEWVLSISLGATARFTYHHPNDGAGYYSTDVLVDSGDVLLFNGGFLYHSVQVLESTVPEWWEKEFGNFRGRLNLQYRILTGTTQQSQKTQDTSTLSQEHRTPGQHKRTKQLKEISKQKANAKDNTWLKRVEDKPSIDSGQPYLMHGVEGKPNTNTGQPYLMRVEDKPSTDSDNRWLMRVEDKPSTDSDNRWLMRVEDKPGTDSDNRWLMQVEDKPSTNSGQPYLMRVEDKPSTNSDNRWLMRVEDKPSTNSGQSYLMRVEDKPSTNSDNRWLMRVEDKPSTDSDNRWLMRVEDKPCTSSGQPYLMRVEDKPSTDVDCPGWSTEKVSTKTTAVCETRFLNNLVAGNISSDISFSHSPENLHKRISENVSWLPLLEESDRELEGNPLFLGAFDAVPYLGFTNNYFRKFWCFNYTINKDHQIRSILALGGNANSNEVKGHFYEKLKLIQGLNIPVHEKRIVLSFEDSDVVESMYKARLLVNPKEFILKGNHIFSKKERQKITDKTAEALNFIRQADSVLYESMLQVVACIGYYKAAEKGHLGGTVSSAIGLIWLDPSKGGDWSIPFLAEQMVHEYIHTTLFIAEMVRGMYADVSLVPKSLVVSAIRRQKRGYDKSFHAAYVATGLVAFHAKTGSIDRAAELAKYLNQSVQDLEKVQLETGILDDTGTGMLLHLKTFLHKAKLI